MPKKSGRGEAQQKKQGGGNVAALSVEKETLTNKDKEDNRRTRYEEAYDN